MKLISAKTISLKSHPEVNEAAIQEFIFNNPSILGLGDLSPIRREKVLPTGGRMDMLLGDDDTRYEVEIMLGSTDPSHIVRTIEYWDSEKKRYPRYNHVAVIVAENITARFLNVIGLLNGTIPIIALQMVATHTGQEISLVFVKVMDYTGLGTDEENEAEPTDRKYWESHSNVLKYMDDIYSDVKEYALGYELKYNKFYVGLAKDGVASNFVFFKPKKKFLYFYIRVPENDETSVSLDGASMDYDYNSRDQAYKIKITNSKEYQDNRALLKELGRAAMEHRKLVVQ